MTRTITIEIPEAGDETKSFDVVDQQGRRANGLNFDEMLGQVVSMTHPGLNGEPQYTMRTPEEWAQWLAVHFARRQSNKDTPPHDPVLPF